MYIKIRVITESKKEYIKETGENRFEIAVKAKAERNMANKRVVEMVISHLKAKSARIINGHQSPSKLLSVDL